MAPPPAEAPPAKVKTPPPLQWSRLPVTDYLCTRFGPDWERGKGRYPDTVKGRSFSNPFTLTVPPGHDLAFRIESKGSKSGEITYGASGWPAGATLDAKTGKFTWLVAGKASDTFLVTFEARSSGGEVLTWSMQVAIAWEAEPLAFRAGAGGKTWPDCSARPGEMNFDEVDLDLDGNLDVFVSTEWTEGGDGHGHTFSRHDAVLRRPTPGKPHRAVAVE